MLRNIMTIGRKYFMKVFGLINYIIMMILPITAQNFDISFEYIEGYNLKKFSISSNKIIDELKWPVYHENKLFFHIEHLDADKLIYYDESETTKQGRILIYDKNLLEIKQVSIFPRLYANVLTFSDNVFYTVERFDEKSTGLFCYDINTGKNLWEKKLVSLDSSIFKGYMLYKIWYNAQKNYLYANYYSLPYRYEDINGICQIIAVDSDNIIYSDAGQFVMPASNKNFDNPYVSRDGNLYGLKIEDEQTDGLEALNIKYRKRIIKLKQNQRYVLFSPIKNKYIVGVETVKVNWLAKFWFGNGYYTQYEYYLCDKVDNDLYIQVKFKTKLAISDVK